MNASAGPRSEVLSREAASGRKASSDGLVREAGRRGKVRWERVGSWRRDGYPLLEDAHLRHRHERDSHGELGDAADEQVDRDGQAHEEGPAARDAGDPPHGLTKGSHMCPERVQNEPHRTEFSPRPIRP